METKKEKKNNNGLVAFLVILLLVFAAGSVLLFTGVVKSPMVKCEETKEIIYEDDTKKDSSTVQTSEERYKKYLDSLAASIKKNYVSSHETEENQYEKWTKDKYNRQTFSVLDKWYSVAVTSNLELVYSYGEAKDQHIDDNVVSFFTIHTGNGVYKSLYYITTDGKLHVANLESFLYENEVLKKEELEFKNIIEVKQGTSTAAIPIYIDIDGNVIFNKN